ncbi:MAG: transcription termination factor NusA [Dehalococcoidia bacterium]
MKSEMLMAITQLSAEKNLSKDVVFAAVEAALASAYKKDLNTNAGVSVKIDQASGNVYAYVHKLVVDDVEDPREEIALDEARRIRADAEVGETVPVETPGQSGGRIAAQTAKQVVLQRLREAERRVVYEEYVGKENDILSGVVQRVEPRQVTIDLGKTEAVLPSPEQARNEHLRPGQRIKVYVLEVQEAAKGPQVFVSRTHRNLIRRLFELEVPEIHRGQVEIKAIAREAGSRSKVAVWSRQDNVDAVGACVGQRGIRIQNVVNELNGERIDVVLWDPDPARFVAHALSPARVVSVRVDEGSNTATVVVPDQQLSLAIGKEGQNARLAAKLTGWRIDIKAESVALAEPTTAPEEPSVPSVFTALAPEREEPETPAAVPTPVAAVETAEIAAPAIEEPFEIAAVAAAAAAPEPVAAAAEAEPEPVGAAAAATPTARAGGIRFAEEVLGGARPAPAADRGAPRGRGRGRDDREETEAEAAVRRARQGRRRRVDEVEDDDDPYAEYAARFR